MSILTRRGTNFAFPSRTLYFGCDGGLDAERGDASIEQVKSWRDTGQLPFPNMTSSRREPLAGTLDYPPQGSPDALDPEFLERKSTEPLSSEDESGDQRNETGGPKNR